VQPLAVPDKQDSVAADGKPSGAEAVQLHRSAPPVYAVATTPLPAGLAAGDAREPVADQQIPVRVPGIASPKKHLLMQASTRVADKTTAFGGSDGWHFGKE